MWALVESNNITKLIRNPKPMVIGDVQYPSNIFSSWSSADLKAIGLYEISVDESNLKDSRYYINGDIAYTYDSSGDAVNGAYPSATAKPLDDVLWLDSDDKPDGVSTGDFRTEGLKNIHKKLVNHEASVLLSKYDWYSLRAADGGTAVPSNIATYRAAVRTKANEHTTAIDAVSDVDALIALVYDWPTLGS